MERDEWKEMIATQKAALEQFECDNACSIHQSRELMYRHACLAAAARQAPPGYVWCAGEDKAERCEAIVPRDEVASAGWHEQHFSCGDETDEYVCPRHASQRYTEKRCSECAD